MLKRVLKRRASLLMSIFILSMLVAASETFAGTEFIVADEGGLIELSEGICLLIQPGSLKEDTYISAVIESGNSDEQALNICFSPEGLKFAKPAKLLISWWAMSDDIEYFALYGEDGSRIKPRVTWWGLEYRIKHFSLYYFRRR